MRVAFGVAQRLEADDSVTMLFKPETVLQRFLRQQHGRPGIFEHELDPLLWIGRVERHVSAAGFQNAEQSDDHFR